MWHLKPIKLTRLSKTFFIFILVTLATACGNSETESNEPQNSETTNIEIPDRLGFTFTPDRSPIWIYDHNKSLPQQNRKVDSDTLQPQVLVDLINSTKGGDTVRLELKGISNDTVFLKIHNSEILTQQMGSAGADDYLSTATFTLTELEKVKYVNFDFEVGDHASPGTYSREYYIDRHERNEKLKTPQKINASRH